MGDNGGFLNKISNRASRRFSAAVWDYCR